MRGALLAASLSLLAACGGGLTTAQPFEVAGGPNLQSAEVFQRLVSAATSRGYTTAVVQPDRARFGVDAQFDGSYRIGVECLANGRIRLIPIGERVELYRGEYILPAEFANELDELAALLAQAARSPG